MPLSKTQLDRMISRVDEALGIMKRRDSEYRNTDPVEFLETPSSRRHNTPVAEPPTMPQEDSARSKRDLFK